MTLVSNLYRTVEEQTKKNAAINAAASEQTITGTTNVDHYNSLIVQNLDATCDIEIRLDFHTAKRFFAQRAGGIINIKPEDNISFRGVTIVNLDGANAVTASTILMTASLKEAV